MDLEQLESCSFLFMFYGGESRSPHTSHQFDDMLVCFKEDHVQMFRIAFFQLLLQVPATMLVLAQRVDVALHLF